MFPKKSWIPDLFIYSVRHNLKKVIRLMLLCHVYLVCCCGKLNVHPCIGCQLSSREKWKSMNVTK